MTPQRRKECELDLRGKDITGKTLATFKRALHQETLFGRMSLRNGTSL